MSIVSLKKDFKALVIVAAEIEFQLAKKKPDDQVDPEFEEQLNELESSFLDIALPFVADYATLVPNLAVGRPKKPKAPVGESKGLTESQPASPL